MWIRCAIFPAIMGILFSGIRAGAAVRLPRAPASDWATVLLLRFNELPVVDSSRAGRLVESHEVQLCEGRFGRGFNSRRGGAVSYVLPEIVGLRHELTLECWLRLDDPGDGNMQRVVFRSGIYGLYVTGRNHGLVWFVESDGEWKSVRTPCPVGEWTHVAGTFDGRMMRLYINGTVRAEESNPGVVSEGRSPLAVGADPARGTSRFRGAIDEVRLSRIARESFMTGGQSRPPEPTTAFRPAVESGAVDAAPTVVAVRTSSPVKLDGNFDDPAWQGLPTTRFVKTREGTEPALPTFFRLAFDDTCLYVAYQCIEKGQESLRPGPGGRDSDSIFKFDGVETFLQPAGRGGAYFQVVANTSGGIFDLRWLEPGVREEWDGQGVSAAGDMGFDSWRVELRIPFSDLGVDPPKHGTKWRANFCRQERPSRELTAWSPTGGGFHILKRFGILEFSDVRDGSRREKTAMSSLRGVLLDEAGKPAVGTAVRCGLSAVRTDAFGEFWVRDLPRGIQAFAVESPRYRPLAGTVEIRRPSEILAPIVLHRIDPYSTEFEGLTGSEGLVWLKSSIVEPPEVTRKPSRARAATRLSILATPGEYESRAVAFYANDGFETPAARISDFVGDNGLISGDHAEVRWTQRLLKRVQYKRPREDAVFSWRFLRTEPPEKINSGDIRHVVVTVGIPEEAASGLYKAVLALDSNGREKARLPVELRVPGFILSTPRKRVGVYYRGRGLSDEQVSRELRDIRAHGGGVLVWRARIGLEELKDGGVRYDVEPIRRAVQLQKAAGIGPPFIVSPVPTRCAALAGLEVRMDPDFADEVRSSARFREIFGRSVRAIERLEQELDAGEFLFTWMDEIMGRGRFEPYVAFAEIFREICDNRIYITLHNRDQAKVDEVDSYVDVRGYHGHTVDAKIEEGYLFPDFKRELDSAGDEAWTYYNIREIAVTSEWVRLCNGYWLWRSPIMAHTPWIYYAYGGSPFDDMDSERHDFAYAAPHPTRPEMVSSLEWESFREGYDDLRYLTTLEELLAEVEMRHPQEGAVARAGNLLKGYRSGDPRVPAQAEALSAEDFLTRRREISDAIEALLKLR